MTAIPATLFTKFEFNQIW